MHSDCGTFPPTLFGFFLIQQRQAIFWAEAALECNSANKLTVPMPKVCPMTCWNILQVCSGWWSQCISSTPPEAIPHDACVNVPQHSMISAHMQVQERLILCDMYQHTFHSKTYATWHVPTHFPFKGMVFVVLFLVDQSPKYVFITQTLLDMTRSRLELSAL